MCSSDLFFYYTYSCNYSVNLNDFQIKSTRNETKKIKSSVFSGEVREEEGRLQGAFLAAGTAKVKARRTRHPGGRPGRVSPRPLLLALLCHFDGTWGEVWATPAAKRLRLEEGELGEVRGGGCVQLGSAVGLWFTH